jgi:methionyl aminopeptidase
MELKALEGTGPNYSIEKLLDARRRTNEAVLRIAEKIKPDMLEEDARRVGEETLEQLGSTQRWHKTLVRFGRNTTKNYVDPSEPNVRLGDNDIFFVDIGPIWGDTEGDGGGTFVVGQQADLDMQRCTVDVTRIFETVRRQWLATQITGKELYDFAVKAADDLGWILNLGLTGHRLSDYPHKAHYAGTLGAITVHPSPNLWILEIQIRHPSKPFGGFFEDLLLTDEVNRPAGGH